MLYMHVYIAQVTLHVMMEGEMEGRHNDALIDGQIVCCDFVDLTDMKIMTRTALNPKTRNKNKTTYAFAKFIFIIFIFSTQKNNKSNFMRVKFTWQFKSEKCNSLQLYFFDTI